MFAGWTRSIIWLLRIAMENEWEHSPFIDNNDDLPIENGDCPVRYVT